MVIIKWGEDSSMPRKFYEFRDFEFHYFVGIDVRNCDDPTYWFGIISLAKSIAIPLSLNDAPI